MTTVKMLIIIFMHKSSVILSYDLITMRVHLRSKILIIHKNTLIKNFTTGLESETWQVLLFYYLFYSKMSPSFSAD